MTVIVSKPAVNLREELASLRNQGGYQEQQFYFDSLVTNGTFDTDTDWTKGTGWTISGGGASFAPSVSGSTSSLLQSISTVVGKVYSVSISTSGSNMGTGELKLIVSGVLNEDINQDGSYDFSFTASSTTSDLDIRCTNYEDVDTASIDNVSVFEVDANDDVIHTMPKGWVPKDVYEDGLLQREGSAHDYEVVYDGFDYYVKPTVAPSATTQTCVIGVKA